MRSSPQVGYFAGFIPKWNIFVHPVAAVIFATTIFAEANRTPFDLAECESELVGGYHTEYSSMKFALFFLAEYGSMITGSAIMVALFFGGWHLPWLDLVWYHGPQPIVSGWIGMLVKFAVYWGKVTAFLFFYMWVRWTLPRFRFDQLMNLAWRGMIPIALAGLLLTATVVYFERAAGLTHARIWILGANLLLFAIVLAILSPVRRGRPTSGCRCRTAGTTRSSGRWPSKPERQVRTLFQIQEESRKMTRPHDIFELDDRLERIDFITVHAWLAGTYWTPGITRKRVEEGAGNSSLVVGAYEGGDWRQAGFLRVVSDRTRFAYIADVFVGDEFRRRPCQGDGAVCGGASRSPCD